MIIQVTQVFTLKWKSTTWDWVKLLNRTNRAENPPRRRRREMSYTSARALILLLKGVSSWVQILISNHQRAEIFEYMVCVYTMFTVHYHYTIKRWFLFRIQCSKRNDVKNVVTLWKKSIGFRTSYLKKLPLRLANLIAKMSRKKLLTRNHHNNWNLSDRFLEKQI